MLAVEHVEAPSLRWNGLQILFRLKLGGPLDKSQLAFGMSALSALLSLLVRARQKKDGSRVAPSVYRWEMSNVVYDA